MPSQKATLFLALVASAAGVIIRGPNVTYDTYIRALSSTTTPIINYATTNYNYESVGWWDGPLTISASNVVSGVTSDTSAVLIKFDLSSLVGATLVPTNPVWLNYFVSDAGNAASLRELLVPWSDVRAHAALEDARSPHNRVWPPGCGPLPADASLSAPLPAFGSPRSRGPTSRSHRHRGTTPMSAAPQPEPSQLPSLAGIGLT